MAEIYIEGINGLTSERIMNMIKIYSKPNCVKCTYAKKYLTDKNVEFQEINVFENAEALQMLLDEGYSEMPVVDVNGERHSGFRPDILAKVVE